MTAIFGGVRIVSSPLVRSQSFMASPDCLYVGPRTYRAIQWETGEKERWAGRDWRRVKRERRKFVDGKPYQKGQKR